MSIKISNIKFITEEFKDYLESYFEKGSVKYKEALKQYDENKKGLVGFSGANSVVNFAVIYNPENNYFEYVSNDKYSESDIKNFKEAKKEIYSFLFKLETSLRDKFQNIDRNNLLSKEDMAIVSLLESIESSGFVDYDNDLINLDFQNVINYQVDKDNPIITTKNLFTEYEVVNELTITDLKEVFENMLLNKNKIDNFNNMILTSVENIYPNTDISINDTRQVTDYGLSPRPNF